MMTHIADRILLALFSLSRDTRPIDATRLGRVTGHSATLAARALLFLEKHGWVDATRARLTLLGLARAVQIGADHGGGGGRRGPVALRPSQLENVVGRSAPKARRKPPLAAVPAAPQAPAFARELEAAGLERRAASSSTQPRVSTSISEPRVASSSTQPRVSTSISEPRVASSSTQAAQTTRRPCARASVTARLVAAHA